MTGSLVYLWAFLGTAGIFVIAWRIVSRAVAAENAVAFEEWERV
jgi:hypothetical protein